MPLRTAVGATIQPGHRIGFLKIERLDAKDERVATAASSAYLTRGHG